MSGIVLSATEKDQFKIVGAVNQLTQGRSNAVGVVTLTANAATTTVPAPNCATGSSVLLFPATANAAAIVAATFVLAANITAGQFIVTHTNNANVDKTFYWIAIG